MNHEKEQSVGSMLLDIAEFKSGVRLFSPTGLSMNEASRLSQIRVPWLVHR